MYNTYNQIGKSIMITTFKRSVALLSHSVLVITIKNFVKYYLVI